MKKTLVFLAAAILSWPVLAQEAVVPATPATPSSSEVGKAPAAEVGGMTEAAPQIYIKIGEAKKARSPLALPPFNYVGSPTLKHQEIGTELFKVVSNDLAVSTFFKILPQSSYIENTARVGVRPAPVDPAGFKWDSWKTLGAEFLVRATYSLAGENVIFEAYVYHVPRSQLVIGKRYRGTKDSIRRVAHTFGNDLLEALTGEKGMFLSKFVVGSDRAGGGKEIYIMDWDGVNVEKITNHRSVSLSPSWSPDGSRVAYTAFVQRARTKTRNADLFIYEIFTGKRWLVSYRQGLNSGANFDPDGKHLYLTISQGSAPDIYKINYDGELVKKLTNGPLGALNVEPAVSPDGKKIAFSSDRAGQPMIYVMDSSGANVKRITLVGKYNSTPAWSPDGKKIAFASYQENHFDIFVMDADGGNMVRLTSARKPNGKWADNEDPSFSPDGRHIAFASNRSGKYQIYITNLDGSEERRITDDNFNYYKPKWSKNFE